MFVSNNRPIFNWAQRSFWKWNNHIGRLTSLGTEVQERAEKYQNS